MKNVLLFNLSLLLLMVASSCNTPTRILCKNKWEVGELYEIVNDGDTSHYLRGVVNTTAYDEGRLRFTFNKNGTGTYISEVGTLYTMAWQFTDPTHIHVVLTHNGSSVSVNWDLVSISDSAFTQITVEPGGTMVAARLIPVH